MKQPEHMMADECHVDCSPSEDDARAWCRDKLDEWNLDQAWAEDLWEGYFDPDGWFRYGADVYEALDTMIRTMPIETAERFAVYERECR